MTRDELDTWGQYLPTNLHVFKSLSRDQLRICMMRGRQRPSVEMIGSTFRRHSACALTNTSPPVNQRLAEVVPVYAYAYATGDHAPLIIREGRSNTQYRFSVWLCDNEARW